MQAHELAVEHRVKTGKGSARKSRARGHVPGVVYGQDIEPFSISFEPAALRTVLKGSHGMNSVFKLAVDNGNSVLAMVKELQTHPLSRNIIHADFVHVSEEKQVFVHVPLHLEGRSEGVKAGGLLQQHVRTIPLLCLPQHIPVDIKLDVTHLQMGDTVHVNDLKLPEGTQVVARSNYAVAAVIK